MIPSVSLRIGVLMDRGRRIRKAKAIRMQMMPRMQIHSKASCAVCSATWLFLFNEHAGYVLDIRADYSVPREELLKFAEALQIERTGDGSFETVEDKELREKEEAAAAAAQTDTSGR